MSVTQSSSSFPPKIGFGDWSLPVCEFPKAAGKLGLEQQTLILSQSWRPVRNQCHWAAVRASSGLNSRVSRRQFVSCLFQFLVAASFPWLVAASRQSLHLWTHCLLCYPCQTSLCISLIRALVFALRAHPDNAGQCSLSRSLISHICKGFFM